MKTFIKSLLLLPLLLLLPSSSQASTPEIKELLAFQAESEKLRDTPVSEKDRTHQINKLHVLSYAAAASSNNLERRTVDMIENNFQINVDRLEKTRKNQLYVLRGSYNSGVSSIEKEAQSNLRLAEAKHQSVVARINKEAARQLSQCKNNACRQRVEQWRTTSIQDANNTLRFLRQEIETRKNQLLQEARERLLLETKKINQEYTDAIARLLQERDRLIRHAKEEARQRLQLIQEVTEATLTFIKERPSLDKVAVKK